MLNAFTVDLEEWYQGLTSTNRQVERWPMLESRAVSATRHLLRLLREYNITATFFVLGYLADQCPELVAEVMDEGHEIGIHGYYHRFVHQMTAGEFAAEVQRSIQAVQLITGELPLGHRAPYFSFNQHTPWAFTVLAEHGLRYDSSIFPTRNMLYGYPGAPRFPYRLDNGLLEFPASTWRVLGRNLPVAGGFYVRTLPYPLIRQAITALNRQGQPAVLYLHPWELDLEQPIGRVTPRERITHFHGRRGLEGKLRRLFEDFRFGPLRAFLERAEVLPTIAHSSQPTWSPLAN